MDYQDCRSYLLGLPEAIEDFPFGPDVAVFKVRGKMFATLGVEKELANMNLKCDPHEALILREMFSAVIPGYHMNKQHWNTLLLDSSIPPGEVQRMIDNSYQLVVAKLPRAARDSLLAQFAGRSRL